MSKFYLMILWILIPLVVIFNACGLMDSTQETLTKEQQILLDLVNNTRQAGHHCGMEYFPPVDPLQWNEALTAVAQMHSDDMEEHQTFSHTGSDGSSVSDRLNMVDYRWSSCSENIAYGYQQGEDAVKGWFNSPGHCRNLMDAYVTQMGIAQQDVYWTQVFADE